MVRRVVRSERKPGERWKRAEPAVGYEARWGVRRGLVMGRVKKTRQTARVWLDAGTVRRMRRDLADGVRLRGEEALRHCRLVMADAYHESSRLAKI